jgi:hypothetical protein
MSDKPEVVDLMAALKASLARPAGEQPRPAKGWAEAKPGSGRTGAPSSPG